MNTAGTGPGDADEGARASAAGLALCDARALEEKGRAWVWDVWEYRRPARAFALRFEEIGRAHV